MTNYKEILRLHSLGINNTRIAQSCGCARSTVISTLQRAHTWDGIKALSEAEVAKRLYPSTANAGLRMGSGIQILHGPAEICGQVFCREA